MSTTRTLACYHCHKTGAHEAYSWISGRLTIIAVCDDCERPKPSYRGDTNNETIYGNKDNW